MSASGFGARLREHRLRRGLSQGDLVGPGVSGSYVSLLENGRRVPTRAVAERLAARLGVEPDLLLHGVGADDAHRATLELAFARLCLGQGDAVHAAEVLRAVLDGGGLVGDPVRLFDARLAYAEAQERSGELEKAVRLLEQLRQESQAAPSSLPWLPVVTALSRCYREAGDLARAVDVAERAVERCEELSATGLEGHAELVATLALAHFDRGDTLRASVLLDELIERTAGDTRRSRAAACWNAAVIASGRGHHAEAVRLGERAAALIGEAGDERAIARLKSTRAWILLNQDPPQPGPAKELLRAALPVLEQHDAVGAVASAEVELARAELLLGRPAESRRLAQQALHRLGSEQPLEIARARATLGEAAMADGDAAGAREDLDAAAALLSHVGAAREAAAIWRRVGDASVRLGDLERAVAAYASGLDAAGLRSSTLVPLAGQTPNGASRPQEEPHPARPGG